MSVMKEGTKETEWGREWKVVRSVEWGQAIHEVNVKNVSPLRIAGRLEADVLLVATQEIARSYAKELVHPGIPREFSDLRITDAQCVLSPCISLTELTPSPTPASLASAPSPSRTPTTALRR